MSDRSIEDVIETLASHLGGDGDPSREQLTELLTTNPEGPLHFVNLLAFREQAEYPEGAGEDCGVTGAEAYDRYGVVALDHVTKRGGRLMTLNNLFFPLIGDDEGWERVATMEYQSVDAFIDMLLDPEYQAALPHRNAGLLKTRVFVTKPVIAEPIG